MINLIVKYKRGYEMPKGISFSMIWAMVFTGATVFGISLTSYSSYIIKYPIVVLAIFTFFMIGSLFNKIAIKYDISEIPDDRIEVKSTSAPGLYEVTIKGLPDGYRYCDGHNPDKYRYLYLKDSSSIFDYPYVLDRYNDYCEDISYKVYEYLAGKGR